MSDLLSSALGDVVTLVGGLVGGYYIGVVRSRNERRDAAIAEIFKEMMLFYRGIQGWIDDPRPNGSPDVDPELTWEEYCWKRFEIFMNVFYGYEIWLDEETHKMIQDVVDAGKEVLAKFGVQRAVNETHEERRVEWNQLRSDVLAKNLNKASDALRGEMRATPTTSFWRFTLRILGRIEKKPNRESND